jgi:hypothetical protein
MDMKKLIALFIVLFTATLFAASPSWQQLTNPPGAILYANGYIRVGPNLTVDGVKNQVIWMGSAEIVPDDLNHDTFLGVNAGNVNGLGIDNVMLGNQTGQMLTTGHENTVAGQGAFASEDIGGLNAAFGTDALRLMENGNQNTAIGAYSMASANSVFNNSAVGYQSLGQLLGGSNNIALGVNAAFNFSGTESSNIDIGNPGVLGDMNIIRIGQLQTKTFIAGVVTDNAGGETNLVDTNLVSQLAGNGQILTYNAAQGHYMPSNAPAGGGGAANGAVTNGGSQVFVNANTFSSSNQTALTILNNTNTFGQAVFQNTSTGASASGEFSAVADNGNSTSAFVSMGINSSRFTGGPAPIGTNTAYLLAMGNASNLANASNTSTLMIAVPQTNGSLNISVGNGLTRTNAQFSDSGLNLISGSYTGNGSGLTNLNANNFTGAITNVVTTIVTNTPFISGALYTNNYGVPLIVNAGVVLTTAAVTGDAGMALNDNAAPVNGGGTNISAIVTTIGVTLAMTYTNHLTIFVPTNSVFVFTNTSAGVGNTATIFGGQIIELGSQSTISAPNSTINASTANLGTIISTNGIIIPTNTPLPTITAGANCSAAYIITNTPLTRSQRQFIFRIVYGAITAGNTNCTITFNSGFTLTNMPSIRLCTSTAIGAANTGGAGLSAIAVPWDSINQTTLVLRQGNSSTGIGSSTNDFYFEEPFGN